MHFVRLPDEVHVSQQGQDVGENAFHILGEEGREHIHKLEAHMAADHLVQQMILGHLGDDAPVIPVMTNDKQLNMEFRSSPHTFFFPFKPVKQTSAMFKETGQFYGKVLSV